MSSLRRILASRANGALSKGPKTELGKQYSAQNALRHGLFSKSLVLETESPEGFAAVLAEHLERHRPVDAVEYGAVEEMVAVDWRRRRGWAIETRLLDKHIAAQPEGDALDRTAAGYASLAETPVGAMLSRQDTRYHLMYQRCEHNLYVMRFVRLQNEPSPNSEQ